METEILTPAVSPTTEEQQAPAPPETEPTPFEQPVAAETPESGEETGAEPWWRQVETEEALQTHENLAPLIEKAKKEGEREAQSRLQPLLQKKRDYARRQVELMEAAEENTNAWLERMKAGLRADDPNREEVLDLIQLATPTVKALGVAHKVANQTDGAKWAVSMLASGDSTLAGEFMDRVDDIVAGGGIEADPNFARDFMERLTASAIEKAVAPKDAEIAKLKATIEKIKVSTRSTEGPNTAPATGGGGGRPTVAQYNAATPEQRKKWREEGVEVQI